MAAVLTRDIVKKFGEVPAVNGISLTVPDGEFMVLLARRAVARPRSCALSVDLNNKRAAIF